MPQILCIQFAVFIKHFGKFRNDFTAACALCLNAYIARKINAEIQAQGCIVAVNYLRTNGLYNASRLAVIQGKRNIEMADNRLIGGFFVV